ncbi:MAG: hypothetical protein UV60_C0004G0018 [Parcubacteria group bacterium GW2011_GWA2_43_11]|nr:MAG: hypothetical protein UU89_C0008G0010 [Parcubacteria group bacterium GW2011_GWC2_42_11]KKS85941.1 MAG: hypothetical protein UV60_C0004G0018 [Parcubacteria group bacterium GW2011_GWA2_43_11]
MPSIEVLKTWKPVSTGEKRVTAQSDEEKAKYGKFYIIQYFALISPQSDGDHRQSVSITLIKALDGTVYATATTCHLAWDNKKFPCSFKPEATVVWEMPKTMVAN